MVLNLFDVLKWAENQVLIHIYGIMYGSALRMYNHYLLGIHS